MSTSTAIDKEIGRIIDVRDSNGLDYYINRYWKEFEGCNSIFKTIVREHLFGKTTYLHDCRFNHISVLGPPYTMPIVEKIENIKRILTAERNYMSFIVHIENSFLDTCFKVIWSHEYEILINLADEKTKQKVIDELFILVSNVSTDMRERLYVSWYNGEARNFSFKDRVINDTTESIRVTCHQ